jgi:hypothetical protein
VRILVTVFIRITLISQFRYAYLSISKRSAALYQTKPALAHNRHKTFTNQVAKNSCYTFSFCMQLLQNHQRLTKRHVQPRRQFNRGYVWFFTQNRISRISFMSFEYSSKFMQHQHRMSCTRLIVYANPEGFRGELFLKAAVYRGPQNIQMLNG